MSPEQLDRHTDDAASRSAFDYVPPSIENPVTYLEEAREGFQAARIFPAACVIKIDAHHAKAWGVPAGPREVLFVTHSPANSVFWDPVLRRFGAAAGPAHDGTFSDLALRSPDPIEMHMA